MKWAASTLQRSEITGKNTRIDVNQSYQLAYWKERFGVSEELLIEAVRAAGAVARNVEAYLRGRHVER